MQTDHTTENVDQGSMSLGTRRRGDDDDDMQTNHPAKKQIVPSDYTRNLENSVTWYREKDVYQRQKQKDLKVKK